MQRHASQRAADGKEGGEVGMLAAAAVDEADKYCKETLAALDKEVSLLAASMSLR